MDFTLINSFIAVAEEGSFSTAAKHLFLSQQSLSKQIAKLESELGTELLVRSRPLRLTQNGKLFLQTAKEMVKLKQEFDETCGTRLSGKESVHVGIEHTIARAILPRVLPRYMDAHPEVYVRISEESPEELEQRGSISSSARSAIRLPLIKRWSSAARSSCSSCRKSSCAPSRENAANSSARNSPAASTCASSKKRPLSSSRATPPAGAA